jgi:hypothetical protein
MAARLSLLLVLGLVGGCAEETQTWTHEKSGDDDGPCNPRDLSCQPEPPCEDTNSCEPEGDDDGWGDDGLPEEDDDGCASFICVDYGHTATCDPGLQDCPDGEKCTAYVMTPGYCCVDANKCVPIIGDKELGAACTRELDNDDCGEGLFCMTKVSGDTGDGVCISFCDVNNPESCVEKGIDNGYCQVFCDGVFPTCAQHCDPLAQDCTAPQGCYAAGGQGFVCTLPGYQDDEGNDNDDCYTIQSCKPGLICANGHGQEGCDTDACCTPFCECDPEQPFGIDSAECPTEGEQCLCYYSENAPEQFERVGLCFQPEE